MESGPQADSPSSAPSSAVVAFYLQCLGTGIGQKGCMIWGDVGAGIESDKMRLMAVLGVEVAPVIVPFLQMSVLADGVGMQLPQSALDFGLQGFVAFQCSGGL